MPQKAPGDSYLLIVIFNTQHSTFNTQHSTLLRANFLAILDVYALLHSLSYAAAVQVVNGSIAWLLIQCYRMDAGRLQILYHIIKVFNPVLGILMGIILRLAARIEMQRAIQLTALASKYTPAYPRRSLLMTHIYILQIEAGIECVAAEFLYRLRQINLLQLG